MKRTILALTVATLALSGIAAAQFGLGLGRGYGLGLCWAAPEILKKQLGLTDEQVKKLTELRTEHLNKVSKLVSELAAKRAELRTLWLAEKPDEKRIRELTEQIAKLQAELASERVNSQLEVRKILTPEQLSKLPLIWGRRFAPGLGLGFRPRWGFGWQKFAPQPPVPPVLRGRRWD
ncbi:MAG: Spy/CpxP family protein refolding chaperone, partial [Armatimonadota bacterium]